MIVYNHSKRSKTKKAYFEKKILVDMSRKKNSPENFFSLGTQTIHMHTTIGEPDLVVKGRVLVDDLNNRMKIH